MSEHDRRASLDPFIQLRLFRVNVKKTHERSVHTNQYPFILTRVDSENPSQHWQYCALAMLQGLDEG